MEEVHSLRDSQMVYHSLIQAGGKSDKSSKIGGYDEDRDNTILDNFFWDVEEYLASWSNLRNEAQLKEVATHLIESAKLWFWHWLS